MYMYLGIEIQLYRYKVDASRSTRRSRSRLLEFACYFTVQMWRNMCDKKASPTFAGLAAFGHLAAKTPGEEKL